MAQRERPDLFSNTMKLAVIGAESTKIMCDQLKARKAVPFTHRFRIVMLYDYFPWFLAMVSTNVFIFVRQPGDELYQMLNMNFVFSCTATVIPFLSLCYLNTLLFEIPRNIDMRLMSISDNRPIKSEERF